MRTEDGGSRARGQKVRITILWTKCYFECLSRLMIERTQLRQNLSSSQQLLDKLSLAFDPTGVRGQPREGQDSLAASEQLIRLGEYYS